MKLVFICPESNQTFETGDFKVIEDKGIKIGETGDKIWDAKVELTLTCPFCGNRHVFNVSELSCPFTPLEKTITNSPVETASKQKFR